MIKKFRLVPASVFIFDCSRFFFLLKLLQLNSGPFIGSIHLPLVMYASPNALFPLMSLFLLIRFDVSGAYIPLYITGKILAMLCLAVWMFFALEYIFGADKIMWAVFLCAADLGTIMGMATQKINRQETTNTEGGR